MQRVFDTRKRDPRQKVNLVAVIRHPGSEPFRALVTELSYEGCQAIPEQSLCVGETVAIVVPRMGEIKAQVRWTAGDKVGFYFLKDEMVLDQRRARIGV